MVDACDEVEVDEGVAFDVEVDDVHVDNLVDVEEYKARQVVRQVWVQDSYSSQQYFLLQDSYS